MQGSTSRPPRASFDEGVALLRDGRYEEAVRRFDRALGSAPDADAFHNRGAALAALGRWTAAYDDFTRALAMREHADAHERQALSNEFYMGGVCLRRMNRLPEAATFLEKAIEFRPGYAMAVRLLADVRRALGDEEAARKLLDRAIELQPNDPETLSQRCVQSLKAHRYAEALADAVSHIKARPRDPVGHFNQACALAFVGRDEEALAAVDRAIALDATDGRYHYERALVLHALGRTGDAEEALAEAQARGFTPDADDVATAPGDMLVGAALRRFAQRCPPDAELWRLARAPEGQILCLVVGFPRRWFFPHVSLARRWILRGLRPAVDTLKRSLGWQTPLRTLRIEVVGGAMLERLRSAAGKRLTFVPR